MQQTRTSEEMNREQSKLLENAFQNFTQISENLSSFYQDLEGQVSELKDELKQAREATVKQEQETYKYANRLNHLLQILPAGVIVIDGHGYIREYNQAAKELFPMSLDKQLWRDIVNLNFKRRWDDGHDITLINGRCVNISTQSLQSEPGQIILLKDVTETRDLQKQFSDLKRLSAMGQMAASLAHQVRTPLSSALLYASNMQRAHLEPKVKQRFNGKLISRLKDLEKLVEDMLLFARGGRFDMKVMPLQSFYDFMIGSISNSYQNQQVKIISLIDISHADLHIPVNQHAIVSVLENLVNNALQSGEQVGVEIVIQISAKQLSIEVVDNGLGIPESAREHLFEPFFSTKQKGTGLGLAVVEAVIKAHRGKLTFISHENKGTRFSLQLPLSTNQLMTQE